MIELPVIDGAAANDDEPRSRLWRSYAQLQNDPDALRLQKEEFLPGAGEAPSGTNRRQFMQIMGASMALAGLTACRRPEEKILPYARKPEEIIPGIPLFYATAMPFRGVVRGLLVESHEGRPTKVEGNPEHPLTRGRTSAFEQASILNLYDPDRSRVVLRQGVPAAWTDFVAAVDELSLRAPNLRMTVLMEESASPTVQGLREQLAARYPNLRWVTYSPEGDDYGAFGMQTFAGRRLRPFYEFAEAQVVVSLDADFLSPVERNFIHNTYSWSQSRKIVEPGDELSRLYVAESMFTLTGGKADNRLQIRHTDVPALASALAARLGVSGAGAPGRFANHPFVAAMADDLRTAGANGVVVVGEEQPPAVHALGMAINAALGAIGTTVRLLDPQEEPRPPQDEALGALVREMRAGAVDALVMIGANPVYDAPGALGFAEAMQRVPLTIHHGLHIDETAQLATWHIPRTHYLEAWGDGRAYDGTITIIQPLIAPLYEDAKSEIEVLNALAAGFDTAGYDLVRGTWRGEGTAGTFEEDWRGYVHAGFIPDTSYPSVGGVGIGGGAIDLSGLPAAGTAADELEVVFRLDTTVLDGSYANNAWMQELPDPTTKIVWDNVAMMSARTAAALGVVVDYDAGQYYADLVEISIDGGALLLPAWIAPGQADGVVTVTMGYGRSIRTPRPHRESSFFETDQYTDIYGEGALANGVGANVQVIRPPNLARVVVGAAVRPIGEKYMLACTQEHGSLEGRPIVQTTTLDYFREHPDFAKHAVHPLPGQEEPWDEYPALWQDDHPTDQAAYKDNPYFGHQWGMVIDLNACTGCNACVTACDAENNVQMVGKYQVSRGREMHWMRIDRYYVTPAMEAEADASGVVGDVDDEEGAFDDETYGTVGQPEMVMQPMLCQHCEQAPCESVCPVYATAHSPDGINEMTYNRCIGTRYCANNCPYKVRRFNYYNWTKTLPLEVQMAQNPNVTVRFRGVMEKCTYCVQRVREVGRRANVEDRTINDGEVLTACQQVCPADAIVFGDIADPTTKVSLAKLNPRRYEVLEQLSVKPRTSYLARVTNPNPALTLMDEAQGHHG